MPSIKERLERVMGDIGPQEIIPEDSAAGPREDSEFFIVPTSSTRIKKEGSIRISDQSMEEGDHFFNQPDEANMEYFSPIKGSPGLSPYKAQKPEKRGSITTEEFTVF